MNKIDVLAYKMCSHDTDAFIEDISDYSNNSIILIYDFDKITISYKPSNVKFNKNTIRFFKANNSKLNYYLSPLLLLANSFILAKLFLIICWKYRPRTCWMENVYAALIVGALRKCYLCGKSIYVPGDWLVSTSKQKLFSYIANNLLFPMLDYWACKLNDIVLYCVEKLAEARYEFWGKKIAKKEKLHSYRPRIKISNIVLNKINKNICFIGQMRKESGLDIAIKSLSRIRNTIDSNLIIIGEKSQHYEYFKRLSKQYNVEAYVKFLGFVETDKFAEILSNCFCGINILTVKATYSSYTIASKIMHYIQYLLPVIATEGAGPLTSIIQDNELGIVIEPTKEAFINAVFTIYDEQEQYRQNIVQYINSLPKVDIKGLIEN